MYIFLPDAHDGLPNLMDMMTSRPSFLWDHMPRKHVKVGELLLPKYKLSFSSRINGVLEDMGIKDAFKEGTADLSDMLEREKRLVLKHVFHKAVIEVNEEGTEAAASTACVFQKKSFL
ncbi:serpin-Z2A-like [Panicum virgatum]|uniref:serpin-Z2A-like n=1 Tax=Panicum virgatum TaxID=38727 RepID=UPI0019D68383|nr:serpin-Z2A-like [Panicum virgatum]